MDASNANYLLCFASDSRGTREIFSASAKGIDTFGRALTDRDIAETNDLSAMVAKWLPFTINFDPERGRAMLFHAASHGAPMVLRDILCLIGLQDMTVEQAKDLGVLIWRHLPSMHDRQKIQVVREGRLMRVNLYYPHEFQNVYSAICSYCATKSAAEIGALSEFLRPTPDTLEQRDVTPAPESDDDWMFDDGDDDYDFTPDTESAAEDYYAGKEVPMYKNSDADVAVGDADYDPTPTDRHISDDCAIKRKHLANKSAAWRQKKAKQADGWIDRVRIAVDKSRNVKEHSRKRRRNAVMQRDIRLC